MSISTQNIYDDFEFQFKINYILVVIGFAKIFIILRVVLLRQIYMSPRCICLPTQLVVSAVCMGATQIIYMQSSASLKILLCLSSVSFSPAASLSSPSVSELLKGKEV